MTTARKDIPNYRKDMRRGSALIWHIDSMNRRGMILELHQILEPELRTFMVGEGTVLAGPKYVIPVKVALQRVLAAEDVLSF